MLTTEDVARLSRPFPLEAHEWRRGRNSRDYVYITESGVVGRLNEVDPSWTLTVTDRVEREYSTERKNSQGEGFLLTSHELAVTVSLTVKGVTRFGIGMAEVAPDAAEADKSAVTDALKRAARLFGIGGYLLNDPPGKNTFPQWLAKQGMSYPGWNEPEARTSLDRVTVNQIHAFTAGDGVIYFQVWADTLEADAPKVVLARAQVEQLRDAGAVTAENLNALYASARAEGTSPSMELTRSVEVTYAMNGENAFAERITLPEISPAPTISRRRAG
ncbi:MAG: Rad52/Rad22 family DNA repair protein [Anaerolineae bacterium]